MDGQDSRPLVHGRHSQTSVRKAAVFCAWVPTITHAIISSRLLSEHAYRAIEELEGAELEEELGKIDEESTIDEMRAQSLGQVAPVA